MDDVEFPSKLKSAVTPGDNNKIYMTVTEVAYYLNVSKANVLHQIKNNKIKAKKIKNKPKVVRSGKGVEKTDTNNKKRAAKMKRLQQTGRVDDAALLMEDFVNL